MLQPHSTQAHSVVSHCQLSNSTGEYPLAIKFPLTLQGTYKKRPASHTSSKAEQERQGKKVNTFLLFFRAVVNEQTKWASCWTQQSLVQSFIFSSTNISNKVICLNDNGRSPNYISTLLPQGNVIIFFTSNWNTYKKEVIYFNWSTCFRADSSARTPSQPFSQMLARVLFNTLSDHRWFILQLAT